MSTNRKILLLCPDVIGERMAGPAIRYWEFAKSLALKHHVTLAAPNEIPGSLSLRTVQIQQHTFENIDDLLEKHDIIIFQGYTTEFYPQILRSSKILIADLYDPLPLEHLEQHQNTERAEALKIYADQQRLLSRQIKYADYFLCASERQRDLWLGSLMILGRINHFNYPDIWRRLVVVPFGMPDFPPQKTADGFRKSLNNPRLVLIWGGGIWEWFDPLTVIRAVHALKESYPDVRLVFLGMKHPNPGIHPMAMQYRAQALAHELNVYGKEVIFLEGWVPYESLPNYLLDADAGVSAHFATLESRFSFRTRILYYLWAGKPIITSAGDVLAEEVAKYQAGIVVNYGDQQAWIEAIRKLRNPDFYQTCVNGVKKMAQRYTWSKVTEPLHTLCAEAAPAADIMIEPTGRRLQGYDSERELSEINKQRESLQQQRDSLQQQFDTLSQELNIIYNSNSWKITTYLRNLRRWFRG